MDSGELDEVGEVLSAAFALDGVDSSSESLEGDHGHVRLGHVDQLDLEFFIPLSLIIAFGH